MSARWTTTAPTGLAGLNGMALALLLVAAGVVVRVAERLYRRSLLQTGGKLSMRQAWTAPE